MLPYLQIEFYSELKIKGGLTMPESEVKFVARYVDLCSRAIIFSKDVLYTLEVHVDDAYGVASELTLDPGVDVRMYLQGYQKLIDKDAGEYPFTEFRAWVEREYVVQRMVSFIAEFFDSRFTKETRNIGTDEMWKLFSRYPGLKERVRREFRKGNQIVFGNANIDEIEHRGFRKLAKGLRKRNPP